MVAGIKIKNVSCDPDHAPFRLRFDTVYLCAKFNDYSFSPSIDIIGIQKLKVGHITPTTPLLRVICHSYAGT